MGFVIPPNDYTKQQHVATEQHRLLVHFFQAYYGGIIDFYFANHITHGRPLESTRGEEGYVHTTVQ